MTGRGIVDDLSPLGIYELFNRPDFGAEGTMFNAGTDAQVFIMALRLRRWPRFLMEDNGKVADPLFTDAQVAGETDYALAWLNQVALLTSGMRGGGGGLVTTSLPPLLKTPGWNCLTISRKVDDRNRLRRRNTARLAAGATSSRKDILRTGGVACLVRGPSS